MSTNINGISGTDGEADAQPTELATARRLFRATQEAASSYLGLSAGDLLSRFDEGQSLADVAQASGKNVDGLEDTIADAISTIGPRADASAIAHRIVSMQVDRKFWPASWRGLSEMASQVGCAACIAVVPSRGSTEDQRISRQRSSLTNGYPAILTRPG